MRSFFTTALCLPLIHISVARIPHSFRELIERDVELDVEENGFLKWFARLFKRDDPPNDICYEDVYYNFVSGLGSDFCHQYLTYPNVTTTVDYTPTSTYTQTFTTRVFTTKTLDRVTPLTTVTVTVTSSGSPAKRDAEPQITARALSQKDIDEVFQMYRRQNAGASITDSPASLSSAFSSACSCQDYAGPTVTETYTDAPVVTTLSAFGRTLTTVHTTTTAAASVVTQTLTASPSSSRSTSRSSSASTESTGTESGTQTSTSSSGASTPTSPPFVCPEDNNTVVSQMLGNERFDYRILCDTVLMDSDFYGGPLSYSSFSECVAACSYADANFDFPVCQGVSYFGSSGSCYLKSSSNLTSPAPGTDSALLVRIALGITNTTTAGTTTEAAPFSGETMTQDPQQMSSSMQSMLSNSSFTMPMITPIPSIVQSGMMVNRPGAIYSTYVSAGSTFSSGTAYSFATTYSNSSWYSAYYTSYTEVWSSATTVYAAEQTGGYSATNSTSTGTTQSTGPNGETISEQVSNSTTYGNGWANTTEVINQITYDRNGTEISSTAMTYYFNTQTGSAGSATGIAGTNGSANGGNSGGGGGAPAGGSTITSTYAFSTQTVIVNSGATAGASGGVASGGVGSGGPAPSTSAMTMLNSYGTAYSSGFVISGGPTGTGAASGVIASGGTAGTGGASSMAGSGGPGYAQTVPMSVIINSFGTNGVSSAFASGGPTGTGGASSTAASGGPSSSLTDTNLPRSGTNSESSPIGTGSPSGSLPVPVFNSTSGGYTGFPPGTTPGTAPVTSVTATSPASVSFTGPDRSGTLHSHGSHHPLPSPSSTPGTAPPNTSPSGPLSNGPSPYPSTNVTAPPLPTGSASAPPIVTAPGTGPVGYPSRGSSSGGHFSYTGGDRSPYPDSSRSHHRTSESSPSGTAPSSAPSGLSSSHRPSHLLPSPTTSLNTAPLSTGTPPVSASSGLPAHHGPTHPLTPPNTAPGTAPLSTGTSPASVSIPSAPRNGTISSTPTNTAPPLSTLPTGHILPSTCGNMTMGTTTIFSTTTVYGCYSSCLPWGGYGGGPQSFGPPSWAHPTGT